MAVQKAKGQVIKRTGEYIHSRLSKKQNAYTLVNIIISNISGYVSFAEGRDDRLNMRLCKKKQKRLREKNLERNTLGKKQQATPEHQQAIHITTLSASLL